jgi:beta-N-acetylhexosaminidase
MAAMDFARLFCFGFEGLEAPDTILFAVDRDRVGAVILFSRNCRDADQIRRLCARLREAGGEDLWILVDQEGGRIRRVTNPDIGQPTARELSAASPAEIEQEYRSTARHLTGLGINFNLAPVADVMLHPENPVLQERTFGASAEAVAPRVAAAVRGLTSGGVMSCAKHFPGLGEVTADPHFEVSRSDAPRSDFEETHYAPFHAAVEAGVSAVMTTHLLAPALDPQCLATYSEPIVRDCLEGDIGFSGLIVTDDLEMKAVPDRPAQAAWYAFEAGHQLLLLCHDAGEQDAALTLFGSRLTGDHEAQRRLHRALERQEALRKPHVAI